MSEPLLIVDDLVVEYPAKGVRRRPFRALAGVSIDIRPGETVGLVGESGSGKSTLGRAVLGLAPVTSGSVKFSGREIGHLPRSERRALSSEIQVVFQDPYSSLNPSLTIERTLTEPLLVQRVPKQEAAARVRNLLDQVKLPRDALSRLPREFSGGQRQRIAIARALSVEPQFIVLDEPTSALDVSVQSQVLNLLRHLQKQRNLTYLFITHNLAVVEYLADYVAVMESGKIVERGTVDDVFDRPQQSYTKRLLDSIPSLDPTAQKLSKVAKSES